MSVVLFDLYGVVQDGVHPALADVQLGDRVVADDLQDEVVAPVEDCLEQLVLFLEVFVQLVTDSDTHEE